MKDLWPAILLAWIAGFVDALGYLALSHVFTAHMSGNSASFGAHFGQGNWQEAMIRGLAVPPFILGIALGVMAEAASGRGCPRARLVPVFVLELACLGCFVFLDSTQVSGAVQSGTPRFYFLVSLLATAMGLQSATLRHAGGTRVRTTYVSGMLTNMTENAVLYLLRLWHRRSGQRVDAEITDKPLGRLTVIYALIFFSFIIGAACGGFGQTKWGSISLLAPIACLVGLIVQHLFCGGRGK